MIYLDYAATAPLRPQVAERLQTLITQPLGNPSSLHSAGKKARMLLEQARESCAESLGAKVEEILFCSGATEADNLAILGPLTHGDCPIDCLISSALEHAAVFATIKRQEQLGRKVLWLDVSLEGLLCPKDLEAKLQKQANSLVSIMAVNNEVGVRQQIEKLSAVCRQHKALLHVDAVQDVKTAKQLIEGGHVDLLALSGHKLGGLHGGLLYVRQGVPINPQTLGGSQEDGRRAGTSEVLRADSMALALKLALKDPKENALQHREILESELKSIPGAIRLGPDENEQRAEHISSWLFPELLAEPVLVGLDIAGVCASSGSACSSRSVSPSRVVRAMGYTDEQANGLVRFSFGWQSEIEETRRGAGIAREVVFRMMNKEKKQR